MHYIGNGFKFWSGSSRELSTLREPHVDNMFIRRERARFPSKRAVSRSSRWSVTGRGPADLLPQPRTVL